MAELKDLLQSADWKKEKHVPVIESPEKIKKGEPVNIKASVGKEIAHPNTTAHHIRWIEIYFLPAGEKFPYQIGKFEFASHGESGQGVDTSTVYTAPEVSLKFKTEKSGIILASSYCNIHGLWQSSKDITVE
ncbi:MAG: class II SORL domain-containing protein [Candidatus Omnitrophica bacterium]|nr:class II SORL domain-containing protein [Candidatus Omnitrophota bacterium]